MSGDALVGGSHLRCAFGGAPPLGGFDGLAGPGGFEGTGERGLGLLIEANASGYAPSLRCFTPARASGRANVSVSPNAQQYSAPPVPFVYYAPPVVSHSSPASGPVLGATVVVVHGSGLGPPHAGGLCDVVCRFGHLLVDGQPGSVAGGGRSITCVAPRNLGARGLALPLEVSLNRQDYTEGLASFSYTHNFTLAAVLPASGPLAGGTAITIQGVTLDALGGGDDYRCRWSGALGSAVVPAKLSVVANVSYVTCVTPNVSAALPSAAADALPGAYTLSVSLNRQQYLGDLVFTFYGVPELRAVSPSSGPNPSLNPSPSPGPNPNHNPNLNQVSPSSGPVLGGALLTISGHHLAGGDNYTCRFGGEGLGPTATPLYVPATYTHVQGTSSGAYLDLDARYTYVNCTVPPVAQAGAVAVRVAPNGQQFTPAGEVSLELYAPPQVTLEPQLEPQPQP